MEIRKIYSEFNTPVYLSKALNLYYGGWEICCPMHTFGPAIRQHYLVHYVTRGKGRLWMNDTCYVIEKDTMFLIRPGITCVYQADKDDPWEYCWICIDGYDVENMLNNSGFDKVNPLFFDKSNAKTEQFRDLTPAEGFALLPIIVLILLMGIYPHPFLQKIEPSTARQFAVAKTVVAQGSSQTTALPSEFTTEKN